MADMDLFYTHVMNGSGLAEDREGQEFADLEDARRTALKSAASIVADEIANGRYNVDIELRIHDAAGVRRATMPVTARVDGID